VLDDGLRLVPKKRGGENEGRAGSLSDLVLNFRNVLGPVGHIGSGRAEGSEV
jgi:hypothetical protein